MKKGRFSLAQFGRTLPGAGIVLGFSFLVAGCGGEGGDAVGEKDQVAVMQEQMVTMQEQMEAMQEMQQTERLRMPPSLPGQRDGGSGGRGGRRGS